MLTEVNWSGNIRYAAHQLVRPSSIDELRTVVSRAKHVKALGSRHSFNRIADTDGVLIPTEALDIPIELDTDRGRVRTGAGIRYGDLGRWLDARGWALSNLASLPHISVGGAISTGTHGSGNSNKSLAAAVAAVEFVTASGDLLRFERGDAEFPGAVVALGALGVLTAVELEVEPAFTVAQTVYEAVPFDDVLAQLDEVTSSAYSVSLFTTFRSPDLVDQVWRKGRPDRATRELPLLAGREASGPRHPLPGVSAKSRTTQGGVAGRWLDRLPHFVLEFTPSNGHELQSEYILPRDRAGEALGAVRALSAQLSPMLQVCEIRTIAGDDLWLSPAYGRDSIGIHFTWILDEPGVAAVLPALEAALAPFGARPHWGKVYSAAADDRMSDLYPHWQQFVELRNRLDPGGAFANDFLGALFR
ncbi:D-arabinono-1,4-lactone oxidase [Microbacterium deminutum]|uniref:Alditol oxidase n=1 Tax=Microbacterium deminutum TaxID=344164 RepID=A0ABN2R5J1_9MICO